MTHDVIKFTHSRRTELPETQRPVQPRDHQGDTEPSAAPVTFSDVPPEAHVQSRQETPVVVQFADYPQDAVSRGNADDSAVRRPKTTSGQVKRHAETRGGFRRGDRVGRRGAGRSGLDR
jgi:hypothetical protein